MFKKSVSLVIMVALLVLGMNAYAQDKNAATKFVRGLANGITAFIEIPKQVYLTSKEREPFTGLTYGLAKGVCYGLLRTASGVYEVVTFAIPPYDKPVLEPDFVFEGWD